MGAAGSPRHRAEARLLAPALGVWAVAWLVVSLPDLGVPRLVAPAVLWSGALGCLLWMLRRRRASAAALLVACSAAALVATVAGYALASRDASPLARAAASHGTAEVVIELTSTPRAARAGAGAPAWAAEASAHLLRADGTTVSVDGRAVAAVPVTVEFDPGEGRAAFASRVRVEVRVFSAPAAERSAYRLRGVEPGEVSPPPWWAGWAEPLRAALVSAAAGLGGDGGALVPGLAVGDTSAVGDGLDQAMKASSLSHLTAVSGANCALVTAGAFWVCGRLRARRGIRVLVAVLALIAFTVLVTPQASVVRAAAMALVVLAAFAAGRPGGGVAALSAAILLLLAIDPWYARDYGFALSAAATGGLLLLARPLGAALGRVMPRPLAFVVAVPLAAQLACQPVLVLLDPSVSIAGVAANLLAAPAAPIGTVLGLAACLVLPWLPSVGFALAQLAWLPASWIALVAHGAAGLPCSRLPWLPDAPGALLLAACTLLGLWLALARRRPRRLVLAAALALAVAVAVPLGAAGGAGLVSALGRPADWDVAVCDIGQGDAVLLRSEQHVALIDTGPDPAALERCLALVGVDRVELLVLTHWDADHVGGASALGGRVDVVLHGPLDGARSSRALGPLVDGGAEHVEVTAGRSGTLGALAWRVLWPEQRALPGNDASVVLEVDAPDYRGVFLGDLGEQAQVRLRRAAAPGPVDLVKVAHHGSADQSEPLYRELRASVGLIGVGADNGYGHPTERLLGMLSTSGTTVLRTDRSGTVLLDADDGAFRIWSERRDAGPPAGRPAGGP
ncbi:ComEC/Rec2 family competence protein [Agromyces soli]